MFEKKPGTENLPSTESFTPLISALDGAIDFCSSDIISGWVCDTSHPDQPIAIDICKGEKILINSIPADRIRRDLEATLGDNIAHGFELKLRDYIDDHNLNELNIFVSGTDIHIPGSPVTINKSDSAERPIVTSPGQPDATIRAHIDSVTSSSITGWALSTHDPSYPCVLSLRSGETVLSKTVANKFRRDLVKSGIGNGRHGFSIPLTPALRPFLHGPLHIYEEFTGLPVTRQPLSIPLATENEGLQFDPRNKIFAESGIPDPVRPQYNDALCVMRTASPRRLKPAKYCLAMIASRNYIPYARVLERSFVEHHPEFAVTILIPDGTRDDFKFFPNAEVCLMEDIGLSDWEWYAAKFSASEFCNALKPAFLKYLSQFYDRAIYLDTDIAVFSPLTEMIDLLDVYNLVLIPHMHSPFPRPEQYWVQPNRGDIFNAGLINGGCFALRLKDCDEFLTQWAEMNLAVGSFFDGAGYQTDQQNLNWALVSMDGVHVLRCDRFNIAYWNIHERDLRVHESDGSTSFTVGPSPLGFFHFSGYDIGDPLQFSQHDRRNSVYNLPAVATLLNWYSNEVSNDSSASLLNTEYRFDRLPNGFPLNKSIRQSLKRYESFIPRFDVRTVLGSQALCAFLMDPLPATKSLLPFVFADLLNHRPDLIPLCSDAHTSTNPQGFWSWLVRHGASEHGVGIDFLLNRYRRLLISASMRDLYSKVIQLVPVAQSEFLGDDRLGAGELLLQSGRQDLASEHLEGKWEWRFTSELDVILRIYTERDDVRAAFPDVFGRDRGTFTNWLLEHGRKEHGLPKSFVERFKKADLNRSLSGIFTYVCRQSFIWDTARNHFLDDDIGPFLKEILRDAGENLEYDIDDVVILRFVHATARHVLVPFYLEMPFIRRDDGASRSAKRNSTLLPIHIRDHGWARKGCADHAAMFDVVDSAIEDEVRAWGAKTLGSTNDVLDFLRGPKTIGSAIRWVEPLARRTAVKLRTQGCDVGDIEDRLSRRMETPGVNVFGYFASDIGIGESSRGLAYAIDLIREVRRVPFYTAQMQPGASLRDLVQNFDHLTDTNVFVTYPHQREDVLSRLRPEQTAGRRNIAHLAWEQKDANPWWQHVYDRYDEIWTISEFAAIPFRKMFPNRVRVAPNVLDFDRFPEVERRERLQGDQVNFLFVFDAASSMERKNPEGVIEAFVKAFADTPYKDRVKLTLKIGGLNTPYHSTRVNRLRQQANRSGLNIAFDGRDLSRDEILRLIASADCYISLHRSEGFGYTLAEAMYYGIPVVATGYSGNLDYMDESNSYLVPAREVFVETPDGPFQRGSVWGEPDIDQAADVLRHIMDHPGDAIEVGAKGAASVKHKLSARTVANNLRDAFDGPRLIPETATKS